MPLITSLIGAVLLLTCGQYIALIILAPFLAALQMGKGSSALTHLVAILYGATLSFIIFAIFYTIFRALLGF